MSTIEKIVPRGVVGYYPASRDRAAGRDIRYFGVAISFIEVAQLTKLSRSTLQMYSVTAEMFLPSATVAEE